MTARSVTHGTFAIERSYDASPQRVFAAWSDSKAKAQWFVGPDDWESSDHALDFRVGGLEHVSGGSPDGPKFSYDARYQDIVPDERIVTTYEMHMDDVRISVSVATVEFRPEGSGTRLVLTEQGAFLDGYDTPAQREHGTGELLDALGKALG
ncbi:MAG: hypothetical protein QOF87_4166 [Pseudonocardiales bacterium]|jgi:uncharacterized protein YndB with AHSA1/START domain|nr:polyketide cyclase [Pseudonocardiales bacterium]MDT4959572.1 hypothetical protein [Pseudonocardiales bacterium]MDT4964519.1 hypothetical protein [Pseudonocardiales bacterium]MDT4972272.1 hypothetical protein [Pseudonocardiales bacterium]MDT4979019.1 hypothetical protein [Pseudonocardiales bacterium]